MKRIRSVRGARVPAPVVPAVVLGALVAVAGLAAGVARADVVATPGGIRFTYPDANAGSVSLAGSFNSWNPNARPMDRENGGVWSAVVRLPEGTHEYKFVVDGEWIADPGNPVTAGDFGNSAVAVDSNGKITEMKATSNVPFSSKILMGGRTIGLFQSGKNRDNDDRFELRRPNFDTDLEFRIRMNDVLKARILTNINNESEDVEQFRTRLNFDRGILEFRDGDLYGAAWDNEDVGTWSDPLRLVGDVGIFHHAYGFGTQGVMVGRVFRGLDGRLLYTDNFVAGGTAAPEPERLTFEEVESATPSFATLSDGLFRFDQGVQGYAFSYTGNDEDVMAARVEGTFRDVLFGASGRLDRGYNPGSLSFVDDLVADTLGVFVDFDTSEAAPGDEILDVPGYSGRRQRYTGTEVWWGVGFDARWPGLLEAVDVQFEVLYGESRVETNTAFEDFVFLGTIPDTGAVADTTAIAVDGNSGRIADPADRVPTFAISDDSFGLDESWRFFLGVENGPDVLGVDWSASLETQTHGFSSFATGLGRPIDNRLYTWRLHASRPGMAFDRRYVPSLAFEYHDFDYDAGSPWEFQFWFDFRNFWLDFDEHKVSFEKMTLLGGDDAVIWRPRLEVEVLKEPAVGFTYEGTVAGIGLDREPKYVETLLKAKWQIAPRWRAYADTRLVKYNDASLGLNESYNEQFWEVAYEVAEGIELALSYGVDPIAIDTPVNEYAYIGRDLFLFARGANGATARENFTSLSRVIREAESALADARLIQIEAIMRF